MRYRIEMVIALIVGTVGLFCAAGTTSSAQESVVWQRFHGPYGGSPGALFAYDSSGRIWAGHPDHTLYRSDDDGASWQETTMRRPVDMRIGADGRMLLLDDSGRVWTSYDAGASWQHDLGRIPIDLIDPWGLAVMPSGTLYVMSSDRRDARDSIQLFRRRPGDSLWSRIGSVGREHWVAAFVPIGDRLLIYAHDTYWVDDDSAAPYRDERDLGLGPPVWGDSGRLYSSNSHSIHISHDSGRSWSPMADLDTGATRLLAHHPPSTFYTVGYLPSADRFFFLHASTDGGESWSRTPLEHVGDEPGVMVTGNGTCLVTCRSTLVRTTDRGASWHEAVQGVYANASTMLSSSHGTFVMGWYKLHATTDGGATWLTHRDSLPSDNGSGQMLYAEGYRGMGEDRRGRIFAASLLGVHRSDDGGRTWRLVGLERKRLSYLHVGDDALYAYRSENDKIIWRSVDGGETWDTIMLSQRIIELVDDPTSTLLYGRTDQQQWLASTDGGMTWGRNLLQGTFLKVARSTGHLYAQSSYAPPVFRHSTDRGVTWTTIDVGARAPQTPIKSMEVGPNGDCFVLDELSNLYRWRAEPFAWTMYENRGEVLPAHKLGFTIDGRVMVSTNNWGLWETSAPLATVASPEGKRNLVALYPNPVGAILYVELPEGHDHVAVRMSDLSGRVILEQVVDAEPGRGDTAIPITLPDDIPELVMVQIEVDGHWSDATMVRIAR